ncbi:hypothetical protein E3N88_20512 [Mikania micrantha]|uniref:SWIM-type domain-containing protein n=1 Tax=Mikania micrantha TaxID=192012 RepID=A0A5N6NID7_9ASTR|nr:hypothetical protein E3N88_20512 [Mikania micrantha]
MPSPAPYTVAPTVFKSQPPAITCHPFSSPFNQFYNSSNIFLLLSINSTGHHLPPAIETTTTLTEEPSENSMPVAFIPMASSLSSNGDIHHINFPQHPVLCSSPIRHIMRYRVPPRRSFPHFSPNIALTSNMGGCDKPLEEFEDFLSPIVREPEPDPLNDDIFYILTGDSPLVISVSTRKVVIVAWYTKLLIVVAIGALMLVLGSSLWLERFFFYPGMKFTRCKPRGKMVDSVNPTSMAGARATSFKVTRCMTLIRLRAIKGSSNYVLYEFSENHNHELISFENMDLTYKGKHLNFDDVHFVHAMSLDRVGATIAHWLQTSLKDGHHNMRGTKNSYKNISREIRMFIGERDVQLAIFWVDDVSKLSYQLFGDVIAFDATFSTNKYNMIFVPFTGVDHHKKCVTFGAGLIHNETVESYCWLLEAFLKIHVKHPRLVLSDQDPAMRIAVPNVFTQYVHRLCMLHKLVWNVYISPVTFKEKWHNLMAELELNNHIWLNEMFSIRELWVPSYFREIPMCCLMKITSRCERSNSMFKVTYGSTNTLVQFLMCFDIAIDNQRYTISHMDNRYDFVNQIKVSVHMLEQSYECSCMGFTRVGYLCRHIFCVFRLHHIKNVPHRYISNRWRKSTLPSRVYGLSQRLSVDNTDVAVLRNEVTDCVNACVDQLAFNVDGLSSFTENIKELKKELVDKFPCSSSSHKKQCIIEHLVGQHDEETIDLFPPHGIHNKGCGTNRRLVGPGEKAIENSKKTPRMCRSCNQLTFHDSRNCKKKANVGESTSQK